MSTKKPAYLRLYEGIREEIVSGGYAFGTRLPSRRQIAHERGLSVMTVEHSMELLCQEGYAEARPRSGYYVIYREADSFVPASTPVPAVRHGSMDTAESFPFSVMTRVMRRVMTEYGEEAILRKSPNQGCDRLRLAIAHYLGRNRGIRVNSSQVMIGSGAEYLYGLVVEMLGAERIYAMESPSYAKIAQVYQAKGVRCELLPLGADGIVSQALWSTDASVLHITPFRSFPSGVTASASKRREYLRWAGQGDRYLVEDDFESEFSLLRKPEDTVFALSDRGNVVYLNTFSRTISPALRVGYMVLPEELIPVFEERVGFYSCTVPAFEQYVLAELIDSGDFERHINRIRRSKRKHARQSSEES